MMSSKVIYSANEAASNDAGFWSNDLGWVEDISDATHFTDDDAQEIDLPMSLGNDAAWSDSDRYKGLSDPDWDAIP
jgi:hypothetical protein